MSSAYLRLCDTYLRTFFVAALEWTANVTVHSVTLEWVGAKISAIFAAFFRALPNALEMNCREMEC